MKRLTSLSTAFLACVLAAPALPQRPTYPAAPKPLDASGTAQTTVTVPRRLDLAQLQREADELARAAQSIPSDVESVRKGMLPKDVIQKLKQIEKLSKRLRNELNP
jgi:hypothetical protein